FHIGKARLFPAVYHVRKQHIFPASLVPGDGHAPRVERFHNEFFVHRRTYQRQRDEYPYDYGHNGKNNVYHALPA
ncbi:hypothetical protein, partial [Phocaeicola sp.]|uniref:hypothetical protein n=1 Tax=Phocaeicola sp. TaxID=2773926 RepID=UPI003AB708FC